MKVFTNMAEWFQEDFDVAAVKRIDGLINLFEGKLWAIRHQFQIKCIGLVSSKDYYKRPCGMVCGKGHVSVNF